MRESFSLTHHFIIVKIHTYHQGNMFQLQRAIIRPLIKNRSLSGFGVRLGSQLFALLGYCCIQFSNLVSTLRTGDADLRFYITTVQDGWCRFAFLTRWNSVLLQVLVSATPQGGIFPEVSHPQALLGSLVSISWKFQFTKVVSEFVINF